MSKKQKFDLTSLVHSGCISDGQNIYFVADPVKKGAVRKAPGGEYKFDCDGEMITIHAAAQRFLGQEPPNHASQWLRTEAGNTLYQLWQEQLDKG